VLASHNKSGLCRNGLPLDMSQRLVILGGIIKFFFTSTINPVGCSLANGVDRKPSALNSQFLFINLCVNSYFRDIEKFTGSMACVRPGETGIPRDRLPLISSRYIHQKTF